MSSGSMFLRNGCVLPAELRLKQVPFNKAWKSADDISSTGLDVVMRSAGWHFMRIEDACSRLGCGRTKESAADQAIARALCHVSSRFNAAEVDSVKFWELPGFRIAKATVQARQIQQSCYLNEIDQATIRQLSAQ